MASFSPCCKLFNTLAGSAVAAEVEAALMASLGEQQEEHALHRKVDVIMVNELLDMLQ